MVLRVDKLGENGYWDKRRAGIREEGKLCTVFIWLVCLRVEVSLFGSGISVGSTCISGLLCKETPARELPEKRWKSLCPSETRDV